MKFGFGKVAIGVLPANPARPGDARDRQGDDDDGERRRDHGQARLRDDSYDEVDTAHRDVGRERSGEQVHIGVPPRQRAAPPQGQECGAGVVETATTRGRCDHGRERRPPHGGTPGAAERKRLVPHGPGHRHQRQRCESGGGPVGSAEVHRHREAGGADAKHPQPGRCGHGERTPPRQRIAATDLNDEPGERDDRHGGVALFDQRREAGERPADRHRAHR